MKKTVFFALCLLLLWPSTVLCEKVEEHWENIGSGIEEPGLTALACDPGNSGSIYVSSARTIFHSADSGQTWSRSSAFTTAQDHIRTIAVDPNNKDTLFAGTQSAIFKSSDKGISWKKIGTGHDSLLKDINKIDLTCEDPSRIYVAASGGMFISNDGGTSWHKCGAGITDQKINYVACDPRDQTIVYAAAATGVFKSMDKGASWIRILAVQGQTETAESTEPLYDMDANEANAGSVHVPQCITIDKQNDGHIYIGTSAGVMASYDAGTTFTKITGVGLTDRNIISLLPPINNVLYAATKGGVFKIARPYHNWITVYSGLSSKEINSLAYTRSGNSILAATAKGLFRATSEAAQGSPLPIISESEDPKMQDIIAKFNNEPGIKEVQQTAIRYAEVHKEKIDEWRRSAKKRALLPTLSVGVNHDINSNSEIYTSATTRYYVTGPDDTSTGWDVRASWDLGNLIWSDDQTNIDVRSRLTVQLRDDIINEVTRLYFERRRLQIDLFLSPPQNLRNKLEKDLRLQELTAEIDALTGGWFSKKTVGTKNI